MKPAANEPVVPTDLISPIEAAKLLGRSPSSVRRWCHEGKLPAFKIVGVLRVSRLDVLNLIQRVETDRPRLETRAEVMAREQEVDRILRAAKIRR